MMYDRDELLAMLVAAAQGIRGDKHEPSGIDGLIGALNGQNRSGRDSVAAGLHDIAGAIRILADEIHQSKQRSGYRRRML